jgi:excinuclease ABC subunit B
MYAGDMARKKVLVEHGFRLPSALDNRPLSFSEFELMVKQAVYVSATPGPYELEKASGKVVEQIIRPTGLLDPPVRLEPLKGQIDSLIAKSKERAARGERVLVTTLTKRTAEDLTDYLRDAGLRVQYIHAEVDAIERVEILRALRAGDFDVLVGINLLREGLDLPEVSLVAILDADKEGFLRSETSLIQTAGRAARHINGEVILYAETITGSMRKLMETTEHRRAKQIEFNKRNNITPRTVVRGVQESLQTIARGREREASVLAKSGADFDVAETLRELEEEMLNAAENLEFEKAALLRDQIAELKEFGVGSGAGVSAKQKPKAVRYKAAGGRKKK